MSNISEFTLCKIVSGIKKKDFTSEEVTESFIKNSKKSKKLNVYITNCFDEAISSAKKFDKRGDFKGLLSGVPIAVKDLFCTKNVKTTLAAKYYIILFLLTNQQLQIICGPMALFYWEN